MYIHIIEPLAYINLLSVHSSYLTSYKHYEWLPIFLRSCLSSLITGFISHAILKKYCIGVIPFFLSHFQKKIHFLLFQFFNIWLKLKVNFGFIVMSPPWKWSKTYLTMLQSSENLFLNRIKKFITKLIIILLTLHIIQ